jgi:hypothetical protein
MRMSELTKIISLTFIGLLSLLMIPRITYAQQNFAAATSNADSNPTSQENLQALQAILSRNGLINDKGQLYNADYLVNPDNSTASRYPIP